MNFDCSSVVSVRNYCMVYNIPNKDFSTVDDILKSKKYQLGKKVGIGGYGTVFCIQRTDIGQRFACKIIEMTEKLKKHFKNELVVMLICNKHPNIISMMDQFIINDKGFIIMEFADGGTLSDLITENPLTEKKARKFFLQIVKGIFYLHRNKIAHR